MALAEELGGEIVSADALQVYRGLDLGTAKPGAADRARVPHHLIDIRSRTSSIGGRVRPPGPRGDRRDPGAGEAAAGGWRERALPAGAVPGDEPDPPATPRCGARSRGGWRRRGSRCCARASPRPIRRRRRLAAGDTQRVLRALEVAGHRPPALGVDRGATLWDSSHCGGPRWIDAPACHLIRSNRRPRCRMMEAGWLAEVEGLLRLGLSPRLPAFQAIGYRQLVRHLEGDGSLDRRSPRSSERLGVSPSDRRPGFGKSRM